MSKIDIGKKAPQFTLEGTAGSWSLEDAKGTAVVIYFYPRDNTSGCTQEGLDFAARILPSDSHMTGFTQSFLSYLRACYGASVPSGGGL